MLKLNEVSKRYGTTIGLSDVSVSFPRGEIVGLFGENGAGKSTMMKCILNILHYKGEITLDGEEITRESMEKLSFATCEHSFFPGMTALGHRSFYREHFPKFNEKRFDGLMEFFELPKQRDLDWSTSPANDLLHNNHVIRKNCQDSRQQNEQNAHHGLIYTSSCQRTANRKLIFTKGLPSTVNIEVFLCHGITALLIVPILRLRE